MNYFKMIFIATILLNLNVIFCSEYAAYTKEPEINLEEQVNPIEAVPVAASITPEEITAIETTQPAIASATAEWNNHLTILAEPGEYWNVNSNIPTDSWKEEAFKLVKKVLDSDKSVADVLKSAFFNAITAKIKQENGEFTASTYALIKEFNDTIDAYVKTIEPEPAPMAPVVEETKNEPVTELQSTEAESIPAPIEEKKVEPEAIETSTTETSRDLEQEWNNLLEKIKDEGINSSEIKELLYAAYDVAGKLWSQELMDADSLQFDFEYALNRHNQNSELLPINIKSAREAFSQETGIPTLANDQKSQELHKQYTQALKKQTEQEESRKKELQQAATMQQALQQAHIPEAEMQKLNRQLQERLTLEKTLRAEEQATLQTEIQRIKQELVDLRKIKKEKAPQKEEGILAGIKKWWYGEPQETTSQEMIDTEQLKLQELLNAMTLTPDEKLTIENNWNKFIEKLRSFKNLDTHDINATQQWLTDVKNALKVLTTTYHIISDTDAHNILKDAISQYPQSKKIIEEIQYFLETPAREKREKKQQEELFKEQKKQRRQERNEQKTMEQQRIKNEENRIETEKQEQLSLQQTYENEMQEWQNFLEQVSDNKQATIQRNNNYTKEAIKKAQFLLNPTNPNLLKNKDLLTQELKQQFTLALLKQQKHNEHKINVHKNMDQFNNAINEIVEQQKPQ